ncbi:MAG: TrmB family transcriptional regulator [Ignavibacteria bacterium]
MKEILEQLRVIGFTEYEAKVFTALFSGKMMPASQIAKLAGIRRTDVYSVLRSFVDRGYCNEIETNSIFKYQLIDPQVIIDKLENQIRHEKDNKLRVLRETLTTLKDTYYQKNHSVEELVRVQLIRGYNKHREAKFVELLKNCRSEILFMIRVEMVLTDEIDETAKQFLKNGGEIKSVYEISPKFRVKQKGKWEKLTEKEILFVLQKYKKYGEQVRITHQKVPNITIFDRETVFMNINDKSIPKHNEADLIIKNKDFAEAMANMFMNIWINAKRI